MTVIRARVCFCRQRFSSLHHLVDHVVKGGYRIVERRSLLFICDFVDRWPIGSAMTNRCPIRSGMTEGSAMTGKWSAMTGKWSGHDGETPIKTKPDSLTNQRLPGIKSIGNFKLCWVENK